MSISTEKILKRLNYLVEQSGHLTHTLAIVTDIPAATLARKLAGNSEFTITELASICRVLGYPMSRLFSETSPSEIRPCDDPACTDDKHEYRDGELRGHHRAQRFEYKDPEFGEYSVEVQRWGDEPWSCFGVLDETEDGEAGLKVIDLYRRDYVEALAIADRLNAALGQQVEVTS